MESTEIDQTDTFCAEPVDVQTQSVSNKTALISVSDKEHVAEFCLALHLMGWRLLSTGGTAKLLRKADIPVIDVADITQMPEMLDGRVKTLHPSIHAGLLARRDVKAHTDALSEHAIDMIDMVVINLYPFEQTVGTPGVKLEEAIEQIDIGGPAMVRSAAKNWRDVVTVTDASQFKLVLKELHTNGVVSTQSKFALAVAAFNRISNYDAAISDYLSSMRMQEDGTFKHDLYGAQSNGRFVKVQDLRYGENAHQNAALYRDLWPAPSSIVTASQLHGKAMSYNNIADADTAWECVKSFDNSFAKCACVIVKHANPCGVALGSTPLEAYQKALQTDPTSAFGGIIALNCPVDADAAHALSKLFAEVIIAPEFEPTAMSILCAKVNLRLLQIDLPPPIPQDILRHAHEHKIEISPWLKGRNARDVKRVGSGLLIQSADNHELDKTELQIVSNTLPSGAQLSDMLFAWEVAKYVKSNAIVFVKDGQTLGIGAGQMSRVDSVRIACIKAENAGLSLKDSVVASDAFFPFRDGLDVLAVAGASAVIQPGGSVRDNEVIEAANEHQVAMAFTGVRHFRH